MNAGQALGIGMSQDETTVPETMDRLKKAVAAVNVAYVRLRDAEDDESLAFRAQVLCEAMGDAAQAAYANQRATYQRAKSVLQAGKAVDSSASDPLSAWAHAFADRMSERLEANAHKGGRENWLKDKPSRLLSRVEDEFGDLISAVHGGAAPAVIWAKAASMANMAGMVADSYSNGDHLKDLPRPPAKPE